MVTAPRNAPRGSDTVLRQMDRVRAAPLDLHLLRVRTPDHAAMRALLLAAFSLAGALSGWILAGLLQQHVDEKRVARFAGTILPDEMVVMAERAVRPPTAEPRKRRPA